MVPHMKVEVATRRVVSVEFVCGVGMAVRWPRMTLGCLLLALRDEGNVLLSEDKCGG